MCWLLRHFFSELTLRLANDPNIHEGQGAVALHVHGELNTTMLLVEGLSQEVHRVARTTGFRYAFFTPNTLCSLYTSKDRLPTDTSAPCTP